MPVGSKRLGRGVAQCNYNTTLTSTRPAISSGRKPHKQLGNHPHRRRGNVAFHYSTQHYATPQPTHLFKICTLFTLYFIHVFNSFTVNFKSLSCNINDFRNMPKDLLTMNHMNLIGPDQIMYAYISYVRNCALPTEFYRVCNRLTVILPLNNHKSVSRTEMLLLPSIGTNTNTLIVYFRCKYLGGPPGPPKYSAADRCRKNGKYGKSAVAGRTESECNHQCKMNQVAANSKFDIHFPS